MTDSVTKDLREGLVSILMAQKHGLGGCDYDDDVELLADRILALLASRPMVCKWRRERVYPHDTHNDNHVRYHLCGGKRMDLSNDHDTIGNVGKFCRECGNKIEIV